MLEHISVLLFCLFLLIQLFFYWIIYARFAFHKTRKKEYVDEEGVSVILCVKNEAHWLRRSLQPILEQNYSNYEVLVVNDNSEDGSDGILLEYQNKYPHLNIINISTNHVNVLEKKMSLALGIKSAKHEIILITDVDTLPKSPNWIREMTKHYLDEHYVVLGYASYEQRDTFLNTLIRYDNVHEAIQYFSHAIVGQPYRGVARNLSYPKSLFLSNYNYILLYNSVHRDEDLFVNQIVTKQNTAVEYSVEAQMISQQRHANLHEWLDFKRLSGSKGKCYKLKSQMLLALYHSSGFFFYLSLVAAIIVLRNNPDYLFLLMALFLVRLLSQWIIFGKCIRKLDEKALVGKVPLLDVFFMLVVPVLIINKIFYKKKKWK
ncbi:MAG: glycosyltransferase [Bacteroidales bacterium]|nr:glycosyltransferase [Bacteroidales bacterium]MDD4209580.1 glycosyltransferase [Bacteroidales bacterium]